MGNNDLYEILKASMGDGYRVTRKDGNIIISDTGKHDFYVSIPADYKGSTIDVAYIYPGDFNQGNKRDIGYSGMADVVGNVRSTNPDTMIIHSAGCMDSFKLVDITDRIMECTGMDYNNVVFEGHSAGCFGVTRAAGRYARSHPNNAAPTLIMADGFYSVSPSSVHSKDIDALNKMGATIIELSQPGKSPHSHGLEKFIGNGSTVLYLDPTGSSRNKAGGHGSTYNHAFGTDLIGSVLGNGGNFQGYNIKFKVDIYDPETGKLVAEGLKPSEALKYFEKNPQFIPKAYVASLEYKVKADFEELNKRAESLKGIASKLDNIKVSSDKQHVVDNIKNIVNIVSSTGMLSSSGCGGTGSTTRVPVCAIDYVHSYKRMITLVLEKISNKAMDAISIACDIDMSDYKLKEAIDPFDDLIIVKKEEDDNKGKNKNKNGNKNNNRNGNGRHRNGGPGGGLPNTNPNGQRDSKRNNNNQEFPNYNSITSNNNRLVYEVDNGCKAIFDIDNSQNITNMEYYYDFGTEQNAQSMLNELNQKYSQLEGFGSITQKGQYIRINFTQEFSQKLTIEQVKQQYENIERI